MTTLLRALSIICGLAMATAGAVDRPNIVFVLADDLRADAIGHPWAPMPHLDALSREGTTFSRAVVGYPICHVSRAEILTGCCAFRTGVQYRGRQIDPALALWPETLRRAGYRTCYAGKWHNDGQPRQRGYDETSGLFSSGGGKGQVPQADHAGRPATGYVGWTFKDPEGRVEIGKGVGLTPDTDRQIADGAIAFVRRAGSAPFFLHVNFTGPHDPLIAPREARPRAAAEEIPLPRNFLAEHPFDHGNAGGRDEVILPIPRTPAAIRGELGVYLQVVANLDRQVGRIVAALREAGQWENTLLIFSSDHGLAMGSHGLAGKQNQYEHTIGVPLILRGPGIPRGQRSAAQCYLRDLFPTTCDLAGVPIPATVQGRSFAPILAGKRAEIYDAVFGCFTDTQRMIRDERWKLIWYPKILRYQLFDLASDADELHDLAADPRHAARLEELRKKLEAWLRDNNDPLFAG